MSEKENVCWGGWNSNSSCADIASFLIQLFLSFGGADTSVLLFMCLCICEWLHSTAEWRGKKLEEIRSVLAYCRETFFFFACDLCGDVCALYYFLFSFCNVNILVLWSHGICLSLNCVYIMCLYFEVNSFLCVFRQFYMPLWLSTKIN